jgi:hypothetical protein
MPLEEMIVIFVVIIVLSLAYDVDPSGAFFVIMFAAALSGH